MCSGRTDVVYPRANSCIMNVWCDGIWSKRMFIGGSKKFGPIPAEDFPEFARDVTRVLDAANIARNPGAYDPDLPVVE